MYYIILIITQKIAEAGEDVVSLTSKSALKFVQKGVLEDIDVK